jgi:hypothetical protein
MSDRRGKQSSKMQNVDGYLDLNDGDEGETVLCILSKYVQFL